MDGLKISSVGRQLSNGSLNKISESQIKSNPLSSGSKSDKTFASTLKEAIHQVDDLQKDADVMMQKLSTGETKNIPEVMIATEKADIALKLMVQVRNKIIDAYQEIMKMQV